MTDQEGSRYNKAIFFAICVLPMLATIGYGAVDMWATSLLAIAAGAIFLLWTIETLKLKQFRFNPSQLQLPFFGLIIIGVIQILPLGTNIELFNLLNVPVASTLSLDPYATRFFVIRSIILLVFFAAALTFIYDEGRFRKTALMIVIFGTAMAFFGILQRLANPDGIYGLRESPHAIPFGPFVNQHHFAAFMNMTVGLALGMIIGGWASRDKMILLTIAAVVMGAAVIFTGSRGGMLSFVGVIALTTVATFLLKVRTRRSRRAEQEEDRARTRLSVAASSVAVVFVLLGLVVFLGGGDNLLRGLGISEDYTDVTSGRSHFWRVGLDVFLANPVLGAGLDAFGVAYTRFDTSSGTFRVEQAHNDYLQTLADSGILGFSCIAAFIVMFFRKSISAISGTTDRFQRSAMVGALGGCFGILIHSFFDFPLRTTSNSYFFMLLVVLATTTVRSKGKPGKVRRALSNTD
jgi:O-antigen ligase